MPTNAVSYPRLLVRTWNGSVTHLVAIYGVMLGGIAVRAFRAGPLRLDLVVLAGLTLIPLALAGKALTLLKAMERVRTEPDAAMVFLFDLSMSLPIMSLAFVANSLWHLG
jgi:hypothetical protein